MATIFDPAAALVEKVIQGKAKEAAGKAGAGAGKRFGGKVSTPGTETGWTYVNKHGRMAPAQRVREYDKVLTNEGAMRARRTPVAYGPIKAPSAAKAAQKQATSQTGAGGNTVPIPYIAMGGWSPFRRYDLGGGQVVPGPNVVTGTYDAELPDVNVSNFTWKPVTLGDKRDPWLRLNIRPSADVDATAGDLKYLSPYWYQMQANRKAADLAGDLWSWTKRSATQPGLAPWGE